jgi:aspartyl-tRNA(Asn)/glutamyl-tRNA(Gln) amidotransferase subunit C
MGIDEKTIKKIAKLARIRISDDDVTSLQNDLNRIVGFVDKMSEISIEKVEEFRFGETSLSEMRVDEETEENNAEQILSNTKNKKEDFFVVPKIVE